MTGLDMLKSIRNLDADLIEEAEFGTFQKGKAKGFGKKKLLFILAAALVVGTMTAAATFTRWTASLQFGNISGAQPSEKIKQQAEQSGLSVTPTEVRDGKQEAISATDNGVTVTVAQTVANQYGGLLVFRVEGFTPEEGRNPWAWWDVTIDGTPLSQYDAGMGLSGWFYDGIILNADGDPVYVRSGEPVRREGKYEEFIPDFQLSDGSMEYCISMDWEGESVLGKELTFTFTGFGEYGDKWSEPQETVSGKWELSWTLEGSTETPKKWTPNAKIGDWDITLLEAEIGQYSMKTTYRIGDAYEDDEDFHKQTEWSPRPVSVHLKDGTDIEVYGPGSSSWDPDTRIYTTFDSALNTILDPEQIVGMSFYAGYDLNEQGYRVDRPYYYIPFE